MLLIWKFLTCHHNHNNNIIGLFRLDKKLQQNSMWSKKKSYKLYLEGRGKYGLCSGLMPVLLLACLNLLIYRSIAATTLIHNSISSAHRHICKYETNTNTMQSFLSLSDRRDGTMAALLSTIVIMFLACHSTKIIVNFYEAIQVNHMTMIGQMKSNKTSIQNLFCQFCIVF